MDHLSKALTRAKSERDNTSIQNKKSIRAWVQPSGSRLAKTATSSNRSYDLPTIDLDSVTLASNHILSDDDLEKLVVTDKYRILRTRIDQLMRQGGWRTLGITSPGPKAGKTVTSLNLAITMARAEERDVVLIDSDLRKPSVLKALGVSGDFGLLQYLNGHCEIEDLLVRTDRYPNLIVVPGRQDELDSPTSQPLNNGGLEKLINFLGEDPNTTIIVDLPPALVGDDVLAVANEVDALIIVVEDGGTTLDELQKCAELLADQNVIGTVLNKAKEKPQEFEGYYQRQDAPAAAEGKTVESRESV